MKDPTLVIKTGANPAPSAEEQVPRVAFAWTNLEGELIAGDCPDSQFPSASTMKLVVLVAVFRGLDHGRIHLEQNVEVTPWYRSAFGGEPFQIPLDEVDSDLAALLGGQVSVADLVERMITISSNDATNLLIELAGLQSLADVLRDLGTTGSCVLRPISDGPAQARGVANLVTPRDLCRLLAGIATGKAASEAGCEQMLAVLGRQRYREEIPAGVPAEVRTANKNGWDPGIRHDAALIWPDDAAGYCLAVCTDGFSCDELARQAIRERSSWCYARRHGERTHK